MMRLKRQAEQPEPDEVIDLRERLAPYDDQEPRPGWRDDLVQLDRRRRDRPLRAAR